MHFDTTEPPQQEEAQPPQAPPPPQHGTRTLTAKALKATLVLDPVAVSKIPVRPGDDRIVVAVRVGDGRTITADLNAKSVRKARSAIAEHGAEHVAAVLQGKLLEGDVLAEAGLAVQPKTPKPP